MHISSEEMILNENISEDVKRIIGSWKSELKYPARILRSTDPRQDFSADGDLKASHPKIQPELATASVRPYKQGEGFLPRPAVANYYSLL